MYVLHTQLARAIQAERLAEAEQRSLRAAHRSTLRLRLHALLSRSQKVRTTRRVGVATVAAG